MVGESEDWLFKIAHGLCCPQIYVTFSIRRPIDSGFQLAERHISWLELSQELQQIRIVAPTFSRLPQFRFTHSQGLRLHLQIAFRIYVLVVVAHLTHPS